MNKDVKMLFISLIIIASWLGAFFMTFVSLFIFAFVQFKTPVALIFYVPTLLLWAILIGHPFVIRYFRGKKMDAIIKSVFPDPDEVEALYNPFRGDYCGLHIRTGRILMIALTENEGKRVMGFDHSQWLGYEVITQKRALFMKFNDFRCPSIMVCPARDEFIHQLDLLLSEAYYPEPGTQQGFGAYVAKKWEQIQDYTTGDPEPAINTWPDITVRN